MKKSHCVSLLCVASLSLLGQAQTTQIHIAGNKYPVEFGDSTLSITNRQCIASDLATIFSFASSFKDLEDREEVIKDFLFGDSSDEVNNIFVTGPNDNKLVRVDKVLSDKYLPAFALMKANSNAVQKAYEFVALLNNPNLPSQPIQALRDLYHVAPLAENAHHPSDTALQNFVTELQQYKMPGFSALRFSVQRLPEFGDADIPVIECLFMFHKSNTGKTLTLPIDFYNGQWGFGRSP